MSENPLENTNSASKQPDKDRSGNVNKNDRDILIKMITQVDPESVDFEPLVTSVNGAAMTTPLPKSKYSLEENGSGEGFRHRNVSNGPGVHVEDEDSNHEMEKLIADENHQINCERKIRSAPAKLRAITLSLLPERVSLFLVGHDASFMSSMAICFCFFIIVVLVATVSNAYRAITGDFLPSPRYSNSIFSRISALRGNMESMQNTEQISVSKQGVGLAPPVGTRLPPALNVFANVDELPIELMDTAVYWHIPRSAGTTMKHVLATCLGRVITTEVGGTGGHNLDEVRNQLLLFNVIFFLCGKLKYILFTYVKIITPQRLDVIKKPHGIFLNVDTTTKSGLKHAKELGLVESKMADVLFTPYVQEASILFKKKHRGRFFTIVRDPVDRLISLYYYKRMATWEPNYSTKVAEQTLEDFVKSSGENWMVRTLTGSMTGPLQVDHLNAAKEIFRTKFLIGILEDKTESLRRFEEYFGWKFPSPVSQTCKNNMFYFEWHSRNPHPPLDPKDPIVEKIKRMNMWDVELYEYAKQLFFEQQGLFWNPEDEVDLKQVLIEKQTHTSSEHLSPAN